jgi:hypothetical protein
MLSNTILATAILAGASVASAGSAVVINACQYPVKLCNVPSSNGGYDQIDKSLDSNETYTQAWTELTNGNGWSIKLSPDETLDHILQYEYTFHNDGIIWYDLSEVDGNPWNGNWEITSDKTSCAPKQQAYRYATDDAYGMQSCSDDVTITVTLCSGEDQNDGAAASVSSSVVAASSTQVYEAPSSTAAASTTSAPAYSTPEASSTPEPVSTQEPSTTATSAVSTTSSKSHRHWWTQGKAAQQSTTLATLAATSTQDNGAVVTNVQTVYETAYATVTAVAKREQPHEPHGHHHGHPHFRA